MRSHMERTGERSHPDLKTPPAMREFEDHALSGDGSDDERQRLFEQFFQRWLDEGETIGDAKPAVRGLYCGMYPALCPAGY